MPAAPRKSVQKSPKSNAPAANEGKKVDATFEAMESLTPELVVVLCGPIGSPLHETANEISDSLKSFGYKTEVIKLSELIRLNAEKTKISIESGTRYLEIKSLIDVGDELRRLLGNDILAKMAIAKISADRKKKYGDVGDRANEMSAHPKKRIRSHRICHVIDSVKNESELRMLRLIYGEALFAVGVFSSLEIRRKNLARPGELSEQDIGTLIDVDSGEEFSHGQSVRDTFPQCDFFLRVDDPVCGATEVKAITQIKGKLTRLFNLIFRTSVESPTPEENAMYAAASAARNSACLSRQVGAAVTSESGELLSVGWNDVPRSGGGLYGKPPLSHGRQLHGKVIAVSGDERCYNQSGQKCHNDIEKKYIAQTVVEILSSLAFSAEVRAEISRMVFEDEKLKALSAPVREAVGAQVERAITTYFSPSAAGRLKAAQEVLSDSRLRDLIEFSRAIHAEMHAILGASRVAGDRIVGGKIFVTTYPCHGCARHIVASGILEVYYIEPYRKSLATKLHSDSITESIDESGRVRLIQFDGVAPRRFIDLFESGSRKKNGVLDLQKKSDAMPSSQVSLRAIPRLEEVVVAEIFDNNMQFPGLLSLEAEGHG